MLALTAISPHYDDSEPVPVGLVPAPMELINRYVAAARRCMEVPITSTQFAEQQAYRRLISAKWHADLERDHGVVVDAATGVYVYRDSRHATRVVPMPVKRSLPHHEKCSRCPGRAVVGGVLCKNHLEWDRLRKAAARAAKPKRAEEALRAVE